MSYFHSFGCQFNGAAFEFKGIRPLFMLARYTVISNICAFPIMVSQNVCCEKAAKLILKLN